MPPSSLDRRQQPWNKGLLIGQKKPLEPRHVWSIRIRLEIARSKRNLVIFNLASDSKLRACDLVKLRLDDVCSGPNVRRRAQLYKRRQGGQSSLRFRNSREVRLKPGYQCSALPAPDISSQADFAPALTFRPTNTPGWWELGLEASAWSQPLMVRTRCGVRRLPRSVERPVTYAQCNCCSVTRSWKAPSDTSVSRSMIL
jgi:hypothetical protein